MENTFGMNIIPANDPERLNVLRRYRILETPPEDSFNNIAQLATQIFNVPIALVSLVAEEKVFFKANVGMGNARITGRGLSLCSLAILKPEVTVFEDATKESCLLANPLVAGEFGLRFYAGAPLITHDGFEIGTLCIVDKKPRPFSDRESVILQGLAKIVMDEMELRLSALLEKQKQDKISEEMLTANEELTAANEEQAASNEELATTNEELVATQLELQVINEQLNESDTRFRRLVQEAPAAIFVLRGPDMVFETVNDKMYRMLGKGNDIIGKTYAEAVPELVGQPFFDLLDAVYATGETYHGTEIKGTLYVDGQPTDGYFNFTYQAIKDEAGKVTGIMCLAVDVIEQVNSRRELADTYERLNFAIDVGSLGYTEVDLATGSMTCNETFKRLFGRTKDEEFTYPDMFAAMLPEYRDDIRNKVTIAKAERSLYQAVYEVQWPDGSVHWISAQGRARYDSNGNADRMVGILADVTEQKADEQRKNDFIGMVSHELKTPLTSMKGYVQMLQSKAAKSQDEFGVKVLEKANNQVNKMTTLINGFLNVSRLESGKIHINKQLFDMAALVKETEEESIATISSHKVVFAPVERTMVMADRDKIGQVVNNLISNAVKYSPLGSTIKVACVTINGRALVSVKDEGMGIAPNDIDRLFERYYRVESNSMAAISGFGIGLYLCAEIIERHEGEIGVESDLGKGSNFWFTLPVDPA